MGEIDTTTAEETDFGDGEVEYVFYIYDEEPEDIRYAFWAHMEDIAVSLFERTPDNGIWINHDPVKSDYAGVEPTETLREVIGDLFTEEGLDPEIFEELPEHEKDFVGLIYGTITEEGTIPDMMWEFLRECKKPDEDETAVY